MSGIITDNIGRSSGLVKAATSGDTAAGTLKAWINFIGTTPAIRGSGNVSSLTDNGTGDFTITFTSALADANYGLAGMAYYSLTDGGAGNNHLIEGNRNSGSMVAGSFRVITQGDTAAQDHIVSAICVYR